MWPAKNMKAYRQITMARQIQLTGLICLQAVSLMLLAGCWTPPNGNVQPKGEPRLIQSGVSVERTAVPAHGAKRRCRARLNLKLSDGTPLTCTVSPQVKNLDQVQAGDAVKVTLAEKLAVYVLKDGKLPGADGTEQVISVIARFKWWIPATFVDVAISQWPDGSFEGQPGHKIVGDASGDSVTLKAPRR